MSSVWKAGLATVGFILIVSAFIFGCMLWPVVTAIVYLSMFSIWMIGFLFCMFFSIFDD